MIIHVFAAYGVVVVFSCIYENISEPQLPRLRTALNVIAYRGLAFETGLMWIDHVCTICTIRVNMD